MAVDPSPALHDLDTVRLSLTAGVGIDQHLEITYIYLSKPSFQFQIKSLYTDSPTKMQDYGVFLANRQCVRRVANLSVLIGRPGYDTGGSDGCNVKGNAHSKLEILLATMVHKDVVEARDRELAFGFVNPANEDRDDHRAIVAALLCDFLADIVALGEVGVLKEECSRETTQSPAGIRYPTSVRPTMSLSEYWTRRREAGGKETIKEVKAAGLSEDWQLGGIDPRPQRRVKLLHEKRVEGEENVEVENKLIRRALSGGRALRDGAGQAAF